MNQLYERIRAICEEKNISIGELSREAKLSDDDRQALKRGQRMNISLGAAKNIARVLGVSIDSLAEYETPNLVSSLSRSQLQQAAETYEAIIRREVVEDRFRERGLDPNEYPVYFEEALSQYCDALDSQLFEGEALERVAECLAKMGAEN
ncbi:helix-turn-helix domain-containing protein [Intestinimonas massiliensis (ex Afouda et al. 2020)]|uniref:Helix-turn-helix transcriptional regulator n=1 Tax=Intestinimonas massiliensis (ex Afouda et al. 2020) TaxID=1673721 RepID=A0ABS9MDI6_9FIRM|nr:helix-turn-helix transcriptional regulator [Intestinimonas massiliensis (ex Afouda et al. 2020)]MCG4528870.1 helix-turn-helix transcriptional regulator [Intestinimonas massiliensis (ex Afouda et al. 2020)]